MLSKEDLLLSIGIIAAGWFALSQFVNYEISSDHEVAVVMDELADRDIRKQPGEPGSTADSAGGVLPVFRLVRTADQMEWIVMSGDKVATRMTATFEKAWTGGTRIKTKVERGDAPDGFTSPAFRSEGLTLGLFKSAIEDDLDLIGSPGWGPECNDLRNEILYGDAGASGNPLGRMNLRDDLLEMGCDVNAEPNDFKTVTDTMSDGDDSANPPKSVPFQKVSPY